jgi:hypothetical protein
LQHPSPLSLKRNFSKEALLSHKKCNDTATAAAAAMNERREFLERRLTTKIPFPETIIKLIGGLKSLCKINKNRL